MNTCIRIYLNGDWRRFVSRCPQETQDWLDYNRIMRFGNAIIIDGEIKNQGYFVTYDEIMEHVRRIDKVPIYGWSEPQPVSDDYIKLQGLPCPES